MATADQRDPYTDLARVLQDFWEEYTGIRPARVRVAAGEQAIAVCLEGVLSPAERQMASTRVGYHMLEDLEERISKQAIPYLQQLIEGAVQHREVQIELQPDVANGNVLGFFRLD